MMATTNTRPPPGIRLTATERRDAIVDAAMHEFALGGFDATPAAVIASRAGVSPPYLFALFGTKRNLFNAAVKRGFGRVRSAIEHAAEEHSEPGDALNGASVALHSLLQERTLLLLQLQAFAACADLDVRAVTRAEFEKTSRAMASACGAPGPLPRSLLAELAMLCVATAIDIPEAWS